MGSNLQIQYGIDVYYGPKNSKGQCFWGNLGNLARSLQIDEDEVFNSTWCIRLEESTDSNIVFWKKKRIFQEWPNLLNIRNFKDRKDAWDFELSLMKEKIPFIVEYDSFYADPNRSFPHEGLNFAIMQEIDEYTKDVLICSNWNNLSPKINLSLEEYHSARHSEYTNYSTLAYLDPNYYIPMTFEQRLDKLVSNSLEMLNSGVESLLKLKRYLLDTVFTDIEQVKYAVVPLQIFHWETYEFLRYFQRFLLLNSKTEDIVKISWDFEQLIEAVYIIRASILKNFIMNKELIHRVTSERFDNLVIMMTSISEQILQNLDNKGGLKKSYLS